MSSIFTGISDETFKPELLAALVASTGAVLHLPADRLLLDVLRAHGVAQLFS